MRTPVGTGWLARQQAAKAALLARDAGHHPVASTDVGQQRAAMLQEKADADRLAREAAEAKITTTVTQCPCCHGQGHLPVRDAAKIVEAVRRYDFVGWRPDVGTVAELMKGAITVDRDGKPVIETASLVELPEQPALALDGDDAGSDEDALAQLDDAHKPRRRR